MPAQKPPFHNHRTAGVAPCVPRKRSSAVLREETLSRRSGRPPPLTARCRCDDDGEDDYDEDDAHDEIEEAGFHIENDDEDE